jgi:hypothetical protein
LNVSSLTAVSTSLESIVESRLVVWPPGIAAARTRSDRKSQKRTVVIDSERWAC